MENNPNGATRLPGGVVAERDQAASFGKKSVQPFRNIIFVDCDRFPLLYER
jgi:hypothetical protein